MNDLTLEGIEGLKSPLATRVELYEEIGSTQERARELAVGGPSGSPGAPHGTLVVSRVQTGGLGRLGRRWGSPPGGLWMSLVLRPDLPAREATRVTPAAAVGVAKALREIGIDARIKWPNDVLVGGSPAGGRKICGILARSSTGVGGRVGFVVLGVGLNANLDPRDLGVPDREVATVRSELGRDADPLALLRSLLSHLEFELGRLNEFGAILDDWRALDCILGERVRVRRFGETLEGTALDLGPEGALLLRTPGGVVELFEGEVEGLRSEAYP